MATTSNIPTPPFVLWSLAAECVYREEADPAEPERVERILRPLRAAAEAVAEGRCLDKVCVQRDWSAGRPAQQTTGFLLDDTLVPFGGSDAAARTCGACPANVAMPPEQMPRWAGCHGMLIANVSGGIESPLAETALQWHRLWIDSPLSPAQLAWHADVWDRLGDIEQQLAGVPAFQRAIEAAQSHPFALHVRAYPPGLRSGRYWQVPAHCPRCSARREETSPSCAVCSTTESAEPARRRFAKGERPYWALTRFLGEQAAEEFLLRYAQLQPTINSPPHTPRSH